jgi:hypothetical protein
MMIVRSQWRVKVAISMVFLFAMQSVVAQSISSDSFQKKVVLKGNNIPFEQVLQQLSAQTKLYFIYSSNALELGRPIPIPTSAVTLDELLQQLGDMMHISFRQEGNYIVVKAVNESNVITQVKPLPAKRQTTIVKMASINAADVRTVSTSMYQPLFIPASLLKRNLLSCPSEFVSIDTSFVKSYFPLKITNPRAKQIFFSSFGLTANEYWAGAELQGGIPSLYAVVNMGRLRNGNFRSGIGLGSSLRIKERIRLNPVYTFATVKEQQDYVIDVRRNLRIKDGLKAVGKHHQLKFVFEVKVTDRFRAHFGPSLNFLKTTYTFQTGDIMFTEVATATIPSNQGARQVGIIRSVQYAPPSDYTLLKLWGGFEGGVSYVIKFPHR